MKAALPRLTAAAAATAILLSGAAALAAEMLTWHDCVERVAKKNPEIAAAREKLLSSKSKRKAAYSGFLPKLTASGNVNRGNSYSFSQLSGTPPSCEKE